MSAPTANSQEPVRVLVSGAAGFIAYSLVFSIARGEMFGKDRKVILHLLDIPPMMEKVEAVVMELEDSASPLLAGIVATADYETAFKDIDVACLVGARPRGPGMERKDLLVANASIFKGQGEALDKYAKKSVLVLVVGNPANTNALIAAKYAPSIPRENFTALTRLDHNRARAALAKKLGANCGAVKNVIIWGNHSTTQYPDCRFASVTTPPNSKENNITNLNGDALTTSVNSLLSAEDKAWLTGDFIPLIQQRGKAVIDKRGASSAGSAAAAIVDHVRDWFLGSNGEIVSMAVYTNKGYYGVENDLIYSFPVLCKGNGVYEVVSDLAIDSFSQAKFDATEKELKEERAMALPEFFPSA